MKPFFDKENFPYWTIKDTFPLVDHSVYNYLFPKLHFERQLKLEADKFMLWSDASETKTVEIADIIKKKSKKGLIHWAGAKRTPLINKMTRADILLIFQKQYYSRFAAGELLCVWHKYEHMLNWYLLRLKRKFKKYGLDWGKIWALKSYLIKGWV